MRGLVAIFMAALAGCNTPGPEFRGTDSVRVQVGRSLFDVRVDGTRAQAIRINPEWTPRLEAVAPRGAAAIAQVSGCRVARIWGDQAVMVAEIDCGEGTASLHGGHAYDCELDHIHGGYAELICTPRD